MYVLRATSYLPKRLWFLLIVCICRNQVCCHKSYSKQFNQSTHTVEHFKCSQFIAWFTAQTFEKLISAESIVDYLVSWSSFIGCIWNGFSHENKTLWLLQPLDVRYNNHFICRPFFPRNFTVWNNLYFPVSIGSPSLNLTHLCYLCKWLFVLYIISIVYNNIIEWNGVALADVSPDSQRKENRSKMKHPLVQLLIF